MSERDSICASNEKPAKRIPLSRGLEAIVDDADHDSLAQHKWCAAIRGRRRYAVRRTEGGRSGSVLIYMHRVLMGNPSATVDHINGDGLDNRKCNLRLATTAQNLWNTGKPAHGRTSRFKGVHRDKRRSCWVSQIRVNNKVHHLGSFDTEEEAAVAYAAASKRMRGEFSRT